MILRGFFVLLMSLPVFSWASGLLGQNFKTSDEIYSRGGRASYIISDTNVSVSYLQQNLEFRREVGSPTTRAQQGDVGYLWALSETENIRFKAGGLFLKTEFEDTSKMVGGISYNKRSDDLQLSLVLEKTSLVEMLRTNAFVGSLMTENRAEANATYFLAKKWKVQGIVTAGEVSDKNTSVSYDGSLMYGVSPGWPWIWLGYGYYGLHFEEMRAGYWSPKNFSNHGPRFDSSFPIYGDFSGIFGANLNFYEEDKTKGDGFLFAAGLQWGSYNGNHVKIVYTKIRSGQRQSPWVYEGIQASCTLIHF